MTDSKVNNVPENRALTKEEVIFVKWLLEHADDRAKSFLPQVENAWVTGRCNCGCANINLSVNGITYYGETGMEILCDYNWHSAKGERFGVFVFACHDLLAGLELWSIDEQSIATRIPDVSVLKDST